MAWAEFRKTKTGTAKKFFLVDGGKVWGTVKKKGKEIEGWGEWKTGSFYGRERIGKKSPTRPVRSHLQKTINDTIRGMENDKRSGKLAGGDRASFLIEDAYENLEAWICEYELSAATLMAYRYAARAFIDYLRENVELGKVTQDQVVGFRKHLSKNGYSINGIHSKIGALLSFFAFCVKDKLITVNPCIGVMADIKKKRVATYFTDEEIAKIVSCIGGQNEIRWFGARTDLVAIIYMALLTGFREGDIAKFKKSWISDHQIFVVGGKGDKQRVVPASDKVLAVVAPYLAARGGEYVFQGWQDGHRIGTSWRNLYKKAKKLYPDLPQRGRFHDLRHTFAKNFLRESKKGGLKRLQMILGHSTIGITADVYGWLETEDLMEDMQNLKAGWMAPQLAVVA